MLSELIDADKEFCFQILINIFTSSLNSVRKYWKKERKEKIRRRKKKIGNEEKGKREGRCTKCLCDLSLLILGSVRATE